MGKYDEKIISRLSKDYEISNNCLQFDEIVELILKEFSEIKKIFMEDFCADKLKFITLVEKNLTEDNLNEFIEKTKRHLKILRSDPNQGVKKNTVAIENYCKLLLEKYKKISYSECWIICWDLYYEKNRVYQDVWTKNGLFGVFYDLYRKIARLENIYRNNCKEIIINLRNESLEDTIYDLVNYSVFLNVVLNDENMTLLPERNVI